MSDKLRLTTKILMACLIALVFNWTAFDSVQSYTRIMLHEMYKYDGNIDAVIVGGSEVLKGYDSNIASKIMNQNVFNLGSASQQLGGSYAIIKEANKNHKIETVFLDVGFQRNQADNEGELQTYILTDFFHFGINKYSYLYQTAGFKGIENDIMPCIHRHGEPTHVIKGKLTEDYRKYGYKNVTHDTEKYMGSGFVYSYKNAKHGDYFEIEENIDSNNVMSDFAKRKLKEITNYCYQNDIKLVLIETPLPDATLSKENYQPYVDYMREYANKNGLQYLNFNLLKKGYLELTFGDFSDAVHLSGKGAQKFTGVFSDISVKATNNNEEVKKYFYDTYLEKINENPDETMR